MDEFAAAYLSQQSETMSLTPNSFSRLSIWRVSQTQPSIQNMAKTGQKVSETHPKAGDSLCKGKEMLYCSEAARNGSSGEALRLPQGDFISLLTNEQ